MVTSSAWAQCLANIILYYPATLSVLASFVLQFLYFQLSVSAVSSPRIIRMWCPHRLWMWGVSVKVYGRSCHSFTVSPLTSTSPLWVISGHYCQFLHSRAPQLFTADWNTQRQRLKNVSASMELFQEVCCLNKTTAFGILPFFGNKILSALALISILKICI